MLATQNPIESEGTYPLPEAQVDRFLMKVVVGYPTPGEEATVVQRVIGPAAQIEERLSVEELLRHRLAAQSVYVDRDVVDYAVELADATRRPARYDLPELETLIDYGSSPRGPIGLIQSAQALAMLRGRRYVLPGDVTDLALDVLRHRIVLSYEALSDGVSVDELLEQVLDAVPEPGVEAGPPEEALAA